MSMGFLRGYTQGPKYSSEVKASGTIMIDGTEVANTLQCCHCGAHFPSVKGFGSLGAEPSFCRCCMDATCGRKECDVCTPFQKMMELMEK